MKVEMKGMDAYDSVLYCGTNCFHRRASLSGSNYTNELKGVNLTSMSKERTKATIDELEQASKVVASCSYEDGTLWGKEVCCVFLYLLSSHTTNVLTVVSL